MNSPYRVLIFDDNAQHRKLQHAILLPPEFETSVTTDGIEAVDMIRNNEFDVVLLDKIMLGMTGDEVCRLIHGNSEKSLLPIIMVTGTASQEELETSLLAGATDFVRKPYPPWNYSPE